ncbi:Autophagy protein 22 [Boothiomyces sp. JEL0866]|nr:Autophagy protein 22 [Boothiomyces sp. JEL0866]
MSIEDKYELDHSPVEESELKGWYSFGVAAEGYSAVGTAVFFPLILSSLAQFNAYQNTDHTKPCNVSNTDPCDVLIGTHYYDTAAIVFYATSISVLCQFILFASLGSLADHGSNRKLFLIVFGVITAILGIAVLFVTNNSLWWLAFILYIAGNTTYGAAFVFYYAWVPILTRYHPNVIDSENDENLTKEQKYAISDMISNEISGKGFIYSDVTAVCQMFIAAGIAVGMGSGETYGLTAVYPLQIGIALVSIWQILVLLGYTNKHLKSRPGTPLPQGEGYFFYSFRNLMSSLSDASKIGELFKFLIGWFIYSDSFSTVSSVAILYGQTQLKASIVVLLISAILVPLMAAVGNYSWLKIQAHFNLHTKQILMIQAGMYSLLPLYGLIGFFTPRGSIGLQSVWEIPVLGMYHGFLLGATQSTCRVMFSELLPRGHESEFFGLYEITDKGSSWVGPLIVGLITQWSGNMRYAFVFLFLIFVIPIYIFSTIDVYKGKEQGQAFSKKHFTIVRLDQTVLSLE